MFCVDSMNMCHMIMHTKFTERNENEKLKMKNRKNLLEIDLILEAFSVIGISCLD